MNIIDMNFYPHKTQTENRADEYAIFILREHISAKTKRIQKKKRKTRRSTPFGTTLKGVIRGAEVAFDVLSKSEPDKKSINNRQQTLWLGFTELEFLSSGMPYWFLSFM